MRTTRALGAGITVALSMIVVGSCLDWEDDFGYYCRRHPYDCRCDPYDCRAPSGAPYVPPADAYADAAVETGAGDARGEVADATAEGATDASTRHFVVVGGDAMTFTPAVISIRAGETVTWVWASSGHSVTSGPPGQADGRFCAPNDAECTAPVLGDAGQTYSHTFSQAGTYPYFCAAHVSMGMIGRVDVTP